MPTPKVSNEWEQAFLSDKLSDKLSEDKLSDDKLSDKLSDKPSEDKLSENTPIDDNTGSHDQAPHTTVQDVDDQRFVKFRLEFCFWCHKWKDRRLHNFMACRANMLAWTHKQIKIKNKLFQKKKELLNRCRMNPGKIWVAKGSELLLFRKKDLPNL